MPTERTWGIPGVPTLTPKQIIEAHKKLGFEMNQPGLSAAQKAEYDRQYKALAA